jgi:hypothetical protein
MTTDQIAIAVLGVIAVWLSQARGTGLRRWACCFGLLAQSLWLYAAWRAGQWDVFTAGGLLALAWLKGLWTHWIAARPQRQDSGLGTIQITPGSR